jgi:hypothetical protein
MKSFFFLRGNRVMKRFSEIDATYKYNTLSWIWIRILGITHLCSNISFLCSNISFKRVEDSPSEMPMQKDGSQVETEQIT